MTHLLAWCCGALLALAAGVAQAQLRLTLDDSTLDAAQRQASQALLNEAMAALPPRFIQHLDREVKVSWRTGLPAQVYGQVGRFSGIELNAELLPKLVDGTAARNQTGRPHGTQRQELLATARQRRFVGVLFTALATWITLQALRSNFSGPGLLAVVAVEAAAVFVLGWRLGLRRA